MAYTSKRRSQVQFTRVYGGKVSKTVYKGVQSGRYSVDTLLNHLVKHNAEKLKKVTYDVEKFKHAAKNFGDKTKAATWDYLRQVASRKIGSGGDSYFKHNMPFLIEQSMTEEDRKDLLLLLNTTEDELVYEFNNGTYNKGLHRLENAKKGVGIAYEKVANDDYSRNEVTYGRI